MRKLLFLLLVLSSASLYSAKVVNLYLWGDDIPKQILHQFEHETGIKVNLSSYDNNETMFTKLKASSRVDYDIIMPSGNYVERMRRHGLITELNHTKIPNIKNLEQMFFNNGYDIGNRFSIPITWGTSGIFYNDSQIKNPPVSWADLWNKRWKNKLLLLDDPREMFAMSFMLLGLKPDTNDNNQIYNAYMKLMQLAPNIKLLANDGLQAMMIDGDASIGVAWNSDVVKAHTENNHIKFVFPKEGFIIWIDNLAITKNAPHSEEAYEFINYMLKPEVAAQIGKMRSLGITNRPGKDLLPKNILNNKIIYPTAEILKRGHFQHDVGDRVITLYNKYWQSLKLSL